MIVGLVVGLISTSMVGALFMNFAELPFTMIVPKFALVGMLVMSFTVIVVGTLMGTRAINQKSITSILKGN